MTLVEFSPSGGLFQFAVQLGEALAARGHQVELLTGPRPELTSRHPGFRIVPCLPTWHASEGAGDARLKRRLRRVARAGQYHLAWAVLLRRLARTRPDVVQFSGARFPVDGLATAWLSRRRRQGSPVLVTLAHSPLPFNEQRATGEVLRQNKVLHASFGLGYRSVDSIIVLGEQSAADLRAAWPEVGEVTVIPHGDEGVFLTDDVVPAAETEPVVLFFGTMQAYKGLDVLLEAFRTVRARRPDARLVIAGAPSGDTDLDALRRTADGIGGVDLRAGYVPMDAVPELFQQARVVAAPYRYANASGVVELARTFSRPAVGTTVGDLPAVIDAEETGILVPPGDPAAFAAALLRLLDRPAEAQRMGEAARARSAEGASWASVAERTEAVYLRALAAGGQADGIGAVAP
ncbi:glycosyltransferase family 4 protein [Geodermatophilus sabuli]|uniref:Glycosyltransferase involved in cell wall bisynthesis n=1 Tax=Geodermatophilus sabuli TaxID=1564158 RepID=A0A285ECE5_9ACTN|nr:glycosyltransferase family 4 protein [Geodermatophilus sabuli]MBB3083609.1 glycosyltransferase involved in cell wall biosynthesis [Geodermatophilus sabuli]SNX96670.1 Glycosyltransferase involved in cell wall bisynthesis [Geodermatophilus sabuli]